MNIIVTGCAGYIGGTFTYEALKKGISVIGVDNLSNSKIGTVKSLEEFCPKKFIFLQQDLLDSNLSNLIPKNEKIDAVFHFAALKSIPQSELHPELYLKNNIGGTENLIKLMEVNSINKLIFSSSAAVYGAQDIQPIKERSSLNPNNVYAQTKVECEKIVEAAAQANIIKAVSLRYFNPIGAHKDMVISEDLSLSSGNIMSTILQTALGLKNHLEIYGNDYSTADGTGERDYIHIVDVIDGHFKALKYIEKINHHEIFNLGTGKPISVINLIETFMKENNVTFQYKFAEKRKGDLPVSFADPSKAKQELNWEARYNLETMCKDAWGAIKNGAN